MPSRTDRGSERIDSGDPGPQEPLIDRQLELDVLREHIARVVETRRGHVVLIRLSPALRFGVDLQFPRRVVSMRAGGARRSVW